MNPWLLIVHPRQRHSINLANAASAGEEIPDHWALDKNGIPTTDPEAGMAGSIAPAGGHKGSAVALMVEVLAAGLTGANWSYQASSLGDDEGGPPRLGQTIIAINPGDTRASNFQLAVDQMLEAMKQDEGVRIPGERRHNNRRENEVSGVKIDTDLEQMIADLSRI